MCFKRFNITDLGFVSSTVGACIDDECAKDCNCCNSAFLASSLAVIVDTAGRTGGWVNLWRVGWGTKGIGGEKISGTGMRVTLEFDDKF